jgi:hypothetical protein
VVGEKSRAFLRQATPWVLLLLFFFLVALIVNALLHGLAPSRF